MEKARSFYVGQMVKCLSQYHRLFYGIGIIVDIEWPSTAHVYTNEGEVICLDTDNLLPVRKEKK